MNTLNSTLLIGGVLGIVLVTSVFVRSTSSEKESLSLRNETLLRLPRSKPSLEGAKERSISPSSGVDESPAPSLRNAPGRTLRNEGPTTPPQERELSDLALRRSPQHAEREYWEDLGMFMEDRQTVNPELHRYRVMALTTNYLRLDGPRAVTFEQTAGQVIVKIAEAWKARNEEIVALPEGLNAAEREEKDSQIQKRYEAAKEQSCSRVVSLLESNPRCDDFRKRLGEWIDAMR